jgi:hypothetical protein
MYLSIDVYCGVFMGCYIDKPRMIRLTSTIEHLFVLIFYDATWQHP